MEVGVGEAEGELYVNYWLLNFWRASANFLDYMLSFWRRSNSLMFMLWYKKKKKIETFLIRNNDYDQVIDVNRITQTFITQIDRSGFFFFFFG